MDHTVAIVGTLALFALLSPGSMGAGSGERVVEIAATEEHMEGFLSWGDFLRDCEGDRWIDAYGKIDDLDLDIVFDLDQGTIEGSLRGHAAGTSSSHWEDHSFAGEIQGNVRRRVHQSWWSWEFAGEIDMTLIFRMRLDCTSGDGGAVERTESIKARATLGGETVKQELEGEPPRSQLNSLSIAWSDQGGGGGSGRAIGLNSVWTDEAVLSGRSFPPPIDLSVAIQGPESIRPEPAGADFLVQVQGPDVAMVSEVTWYFWYLDEKYGDFYHVETYETGGLQLRMDPDEIGGWAGNAEKFGVRTGDTINLRMRVQVALEDDQGREICPYLPFVYDYPAFNFTYRIPSGASDQCRLVGLEGKHPLKHMKLILSDADSRIEVTTDWNGAYTIPDAIEAEGDFQMQILFQYVSGTKAYFQIHWGAGDDFSRLSLNVAKGRVTSAILVPVAGVQIPIEMEVEPSIDELRLDQILTERNRYLALVGMYIHFSEALEFYKDHLGEEAAFTTTLVVALKPSDRSLRGNAFYAFDDTRSWITIEDSLVWHDTGYRPKNREYHEFSHYAQHSIYGRKFPEPAEDPPVDLEEKNHDGYLNPSTSDSFVEGFAHFMCMVIGEYYEFWYDDRDYGSSCGIHGDLEINYQAWERRGEAEELAVAGVLWDLYDGKEQFSRDERILAEIRRAEYQGLLNLDEDGNGVIDVEEQMKSELASALAKYGAVDLNMDREEVDYLAREVLLGGRLGMFAQPVERYGVNRYTSHLLLSDRNGDGELDGSELAAASQAFVQLMGERGQRKEDAEEIRKQIASYDDGNGLGRSKLGLFVEDWIGRRAKELARDIMSLYDQDGDNELKEEELDSLFDTGVGRQGILGKNPFTEDITVGTLSKDIADDDGLTIPFQDLWQILRQYHSDFTSVYEALVARFPLQKNEIDAIFIAHGFYTDLTAGNGLHEIAEPYRDSNGNMIRDGAEYFVDYPDGGFKHEQGDKVGQAANCQRPWRRSNSDLAGCLIKTEGEENLYQVTVELWDQPRSSLLPDDYYEFWAQNIEGYVYVPVPPEPYDAVITVKPRGDTCPNPLVFTSDEFNLAYQDSIERGYYLKHDFQTADFKPDGVEDDGDLPSWFTKNLPFLVPLARPIRGFLPDYLSFLAPILALAILAIIAICVGLVLVRRARSG